MEDALTWPCLLPALVDKTCILYEFDFPILSLIDELAGAGFAACGAGRPAVILTDRSKDRDNHVCYEQHFITVMFGQNSICRCRTCPLLSLHHVCIVRKAHTDTHVHTHAQKVHACLLCASTKPHQVEIIVLLGIVEERGGLKRSVALQTLSGPYVGWYVLSYVLFCVLQAMTVYGILWVVFNSHY